jgi:hypothetical protein
MCSDTALINGAASNNPEISSFVNLDPNLFEIVNVEDFVDLFTQARP